MADTEATPQGSEDGGKSGFLSQHGATLAAQALLLGMGVVTSTLSARMLGPVGRGELAAVTIWPMGIVTLLMLGINQALTFQIGRKAFTLSETATAGAVIGLAQGALAVALGLLIVPRALAGYSAEARHLGIAFVWFTPVVILAGYPANLFLGLQALKTFNLIRSAASLVFFFGLSVLFLTHRGTLSGVIGTQLAGYAIALALGLGLVLVLLKPRLEWNALAIPKILSYGVRTQATNLTNYFNQRIDQLVLSLLVPPSQLGFYAVAVTLSTAVTVFPQAAGIVTFSRGSGQKSREARETIGASFRASFLWLLMSCGLLYGLCPWLIAVFFGPAFGGSVLACRILLPGAVMLGLNQVLYNGASALGRPGLPSVAEGVSLGVTAVGLALLVPRYGYIGAAIVSTIAYALSFAVMLVLARRLLGIRLRTLLLG